MIRTFRPLAAAAFVAILAILVLAGPSAAQKPFEDPVLARMRKDIFFLAGPECEGRGVGTKGVDKAADYIAESFQKAGLKPAMKDGSFFQPFPVRLGAELATPTSFALIGPGDAKKEPKLGTDYTPMGYSPTGKASGELVFAGYGITAPALKYDDYEGLNVEGKIVVILRRTPRYDVKKGDKRFDTSVPDGEDSEHAPFDAKIELAAKHKAAALIIVNDATASKKGDEIFRFSTHAIGTNPAPFPVLFMKRALFDELLAAGKHKPLAEVEAAIDEKLKPLSFEMKGKANIQVTVKIKEVQAKNVVGVLEGAGPMADETVVIGAHYDHLGYGERNSMLGPGGAGKVHYGADDNASGTTGLIELARRFGAQKNRQGRRVVFIAFSGEEEGLFGSQFYCKEPLFPLDKTTTMINMDMIGRTKLVPTDWLGLFEKKDRLLVYGTGTGDNFNELVDAVTRKSDFKVTKLATGRGPSDNLSFCDRKVPVLYLYTGSHSDYHRPTDTPEKIDVPGMKKVTDFVEALAGDALTRPTRTKYAVVKEPYRDPTDDTPRGPTGPRLGIMPDYAYAGMGLRLSGVSQGTPADVAGLKEGDVIVEIAGKPVRNVGSYMTVMSTQKPGSTIEVVVERDGKKLTLKAELKAIPK
jgi:Zn-dependent M28 family amino/carboxypeptidase